MFWHEILKCSDHVLKRVETLRTPSKWVKAYMQNVLADYSAQQHAVNFFLCSWVSPKLFQPILKSKCQIKYPNQRFFSHSTVKRTYSLTNFELKSFINVEAKDTVMQYNRKPAQYINFHIKI